MIRHILFIEFKPEVNLEEIATVKQSFLSMPKKIRGVSSVEWGENDSPEGKNKNFTHCVMMSFENEAARQLYLPHPKHQDLKDIFGPVLKDIVVLDYTL